MEVLFHFIFELFKIAILASIYSTLIVFAIVLIERKIPASWLSKFLENKFRLWFSTGLIVSIILFGYMFTYWGDHGLGDSSKVPVGHSRSVEQINGTTTYIRANGFEFKTLQIGDFATTKDFLFARKGVENNNNNSSEYVVWNLNTNKADFVNDYRSLDSFARTHGVSESIEFSGFWTHYKHHWNGWRFWLLP